MAYFEADKKEILKLIKALTQRKSYTDQHELYNAAPQRWKLEGFGTGNLQKSLVELHSKNLIATVGKEDFYTEQDVGNKTFRLTEIGEKALMSWYKKRESWIFIFATITAFATFGAFILSFLLRR